MAQTEYKLSGPYEVVARDGQYAASKQGSERDMKAAWDFAKVGNCEDAARIINAYAERLQRLDGHDAPLCLIQGYWLCRAMMIVKSEKEQGRSAMDCDTKAWDAMLKRAMVPTMDRFEQDSPYANGNWGAIVNRFRMAAAPCIGLPSTTISGVTTMAHCPVISARRDSARRQDATKGMCSWGWRRWQTSARWPGCRAMTYGERSTTG